MLIYCNKSISVRGTLMDNNNEKKESRPTVKVLSNLLNSSDFDQFEKENREEFVQENFCDSLAALCEAKGITRSEMINRSG